MTPDLLVWFEYLKRDDILDIPGDSAGCLVVMGMSRTSFHYGFRRVILDEGTTYHPGSPPITRTACLWFLLEGLPEGGAMLTVIPWTPEWEEQNALAAKSPPQFVVKTVDDVVFHLVEVANEAMAGRWS